MMNYSSLKEKEITLPGGLGKSFQEDKGDCGRAFEVTDKSCLNKTVQLFRLGCCQEKQSYVDIAIIHLVENRS